MCYRIVYGPGKKARQKTLRVSSRATMTALCFFLFCVLLTILWPEGLDTLRNWIFPGDPVVTAAALEELSGQLKAGASVIDSLRNFCYHIMKGAELASYR